MDLDAHASVRSLLHKLLIVCCALYLSGAHWFMLQTAAWTGMIVTRVQHESVEEAVRTTFDGAHPCKICTAISVRQQQDKKKQTAPALKKLVELEYVALATCQAPEREACGEVCWGGYVAVGVVRQLAPPTPPPEA